MENVKVSRNEFGLSTDKGIKEFIHELVTRTVFGS